MGKIVQNSISYSGVSSRNYVDLVETLGIGQTSLTIRSANLTSDSTVSLFASVYGVSPTYAILGENYITLTFESQSQPVDIKVRIWDKSAGGPTYDDGNDIVYPVMFPSASNKLYKEIDVDRIAVVLGQELKLSEMADAIREYVNSGWKNEYVNIRLAEITNIQPLEVET